MVCVPEMQLSKESYDELLGKTTMMQAANQEIASAALQKSLSKSSAIKQRFMDMVNSATFLTESVELTLPISADELVEYITFLGKGQYLKETGSVFDPETHVLEIDFVNKHVFLAIEQDYKRKFGSSPFRDLEKNDLSEVVHEGQCTIWSRNNEYMFLFHDYTGIIIRVLEQNPQNAKRAKDSVNALLGSISYHKGMGFGD